MPTVSQRIVNVLIVWRGPLLFMALLAAAVAFLAFPRLQFDQSIENMFAPDDPLLGPYQKLNRIFGSNEVVLAAYDDEHLLDPKGSGLERVARVSRQLKEVSGVDNVLSLDQLIDAQMLADESPLAKGYLTLFGGYTHSVDGKTAAVVCMLTPQPEGDARRETIEQMRRLMLRQQPPGMIVGEPVMVVDGFRHIDADGRRLGWASTILLALTIIICFRSLRWVVVAVAVVRLTLLLTKATLTWLDLQLSMVSSMLAAIVTVVGIATVVHVIVRFREARLGGMSPREALVRSGGLLAAPIFWACSTDAVGFASLTVAKVGPVQDFGIMMAIGSLLVIVSVALLVPGLALLGRFESDPKRMWGERLLDLELDRPVRWIERRPKTVGLAVLFVTVVVAAGVHRLEVETDFTKNFRSESEIVRSYQFIETNLGGAGVWDVIVPAPPRLSNSFLGRVRRLEGRLRQITVNGDTAVAATAGLTKVISLADADEVAKSVPFARFLPPELRARRMKNMLPAFYAALRGSDPEDGDPKDADRHYLRIMLRAPERQPSGQKRCLIDEVTRISRQAFPPGEISSGAEVTGIFVLLTNLIDSMLRDQWLAFGVATLGIGLMMLVALRSPALALVALVPNALPIVIVMGLMGWLGLKINMGAAMIAAVSMGLSIDSSIHYITAFRRVRREGKSLHESLTAVHQSVGRAMVFSTLALLVGFTVLCTSEFVPTIYFGALVSLSMLGGLAGNLVVLPLLLTLVTREHQAPVSTAKA